MKKAFFSIMALVLIFGLTLPMAAPAMAAVSTDQADYAPGSVVTISGDNSDGAGYLGNETIHVDVNGPNGYVASFDATADSDGAWSGQVTLNADDSAVGDYSYTATGVTSGVTESSTFTDKKIDTILTVADASGYFGGTVDLSAKLTETLSGSPVVGATVSFKLQNTAVGSATTNSSGNASLTGVSLDSIAPGTYNNGIKAKYDGNSTYNNAEGQADLTVTAGAGSFSINDVTANEGNSGTTDFIFTVSLVRTADGNLTVDWATAYDSLDAHPATAGVDYTAASGSLTWTGSNSGAQTLTVSVNGDTDVESDETFLVNLTAGNPGTGTFTWTDAQGLGTIKNDDVAANHLPTAPVVDVTPDSPYTTDDLLCSIITPSTDTDGDTVSYSYAWYKDDVLQASLTTNTVDDTLTTKGETWKCVVTPNDGSADGPTDDDQVTILNSAPVLDPIGSGSELVKWGNLLTFIAQATDVDGDTLIFSLLDEPTGASINASTGNFTWTPTSGQIGSHTFTVKVCDSGSPVICDGQVISVTVGKRATTLAYGGDSAEQYSDPATVAATLTDNGGGSLQGNPIGGKTITFTIGTQSTPATTDGSGIATGYITLNQVPGIAYTVNSAFAGDAYYEASSDTDPFTITKENATMAFDINNPTAVKVGAPGGTGSFILKVSITQEDDGNPGDITRILASNVSMTLTPVGPGSSITPTGTSITYLSGVAVVTFTFSVVPVNTYDVVVTLTNAYYQANPIETVLTVYDPSLGFTTGGGWFYWPGTTDKTNFGYVMQYGKNGTNLKGSLLLIRHLSNGDIYRIKSNALDAGSLTLGTDNTPMGWASFNGKCNYTSILSGIATTVGNIPFKVYVEDQNEPGTGHDRFWIQTTGYPSLSMSATASGNAVTLNGGNIVVPHTPAKPSK